MVKVAKHLCSIAALQKALQMWTHTHSPASGHSSRPPGQLGLGSAGLKGKWSGSTDWGMQWRRKVSDPLSRFFGYPVLQAVHTTLISRLTFPQMAYRASKVALPQLKLIIFPKRQQLVFVYSLTHLHALCSVCSSSAWFAWVFSTRGWPDHSLSHINSFLASDSHFSSSLLKHLKVSPPFPGLHLGNSPSGAANPLQKWPSQF